MQLLIKSLSIEETIHIKTFRSIKPLVLNYHSKPNMPSPGAMVQTMKAWQYKSVSGGMEKNIHVNDNAPRPTPSDDEILVQVHAMALNPVDYKVTESPAPLK
jgi:hypothetical protein